MGAIDGLSELQATWLSPKSRACYCSALWEVCACMGGWREVRVLFRHSAAQLIERNTKLLGKGDTGLKESWMPPHTLCGWRRATDIILAAWGEGKGVGQPSVVLSPELAGTYVLCLWLYPSLHLLLVAGAPGGSWQRCWGTG